MQLRDTGLGFGIVTIVLHWIGAGVLIGFYTLDLMRVVEWLPFAGQETWWRWFAACTVLLFVFRLVWRYLWYLPLPLPGVAPLASLAARGVAIGLLLSGVVLPLLGWVEFYWRPEGATGSFVVVLHRVGLVAAILCFSLHVGGGLRQQFILRNQALSRILGARVDV
jgi:superoxide oxidase